MKLQSWSWCSTISSEMPLAEIWFKSCLDNIIFDFMVT